MTVTYATDAGSTKTLDGQHGGIVRVSFDWAEEGGACAECIPVLDHDTDRLSWECAECGGGSAPLREINGCAI